MGLLRRTRTRNHREFPSHRPGTRTRPAPRTPGSGLRSSTFTPLPFGLTPFRATPGFNCQTASARSIASAWGVWDDPPGCTLTDEELEPPQFPALTHADRITPDVIAGKHVWHRKNCINCHTLLGEGAYYAPDLTKIADQRGTDEVIDYLLSGDQG